MTGSVTPKRRQYLPHENLHKREVRSVAFSWRRRKPCLLSSRRMEREVLLRRSSKEYLSVQGLPWCHEGKQVVMAMMRSLPLPSTRVLNL
eukprot:scaffold3259_cov128-Skeletonema_dohrnii-CCMP3373.AAC.2